jgi:hypothetical protein
VRNFTVTACGGTLFFGLGAPMTQLKSKLFAGDARLRACLVDNAKHVTLGDHGPHVSKIQSAVLMLDDVRIAGAELAARRYGPTTAKAVLAYKTRRQIINRSYQSKPDDIVGIMTMRALDEEMVLSELRDAAALIRT